MRGDFHMHTTYSDGEYRVEEVLQEAKKNKLDYISITDHDNLDGVLYAKSICHQYDIEVIIGFEFSTYYKNESIHILGYFPNDSQLEELQAYLVRMRDNRIKRAEKIKEKLMELFDIDLDMSVLLKLASITRGSIASEILRQGFPYSRQEIFDKMIGNQSPAYIPASKTSTEYGIRLIKEAGGIPVLAHPKHLKKVSLDEIVAFGVEGIEAIYSMNKPEETQRFKNYAKKHKLLITAGSDFHMKNDKSHGFIGQVVLEDQLLKQFLDRVGTI